MGLKKTLSFFVITSALIATCLLIILIYNNLEKKSEMEAKLSSFNMYPIVDLDSVAFKKNTLTPSKPIVVILFNTECGFCQDEAKEIKRNMYVLRNINLLFISAETIERIKQFSCEYSLSTEQNVFFSKIEEGDLYKIFGNIVMPSVLIYDSKGNLKKRYRGETKVAAILEHLKE